MNSQPVEDTLQFERDVLANSSTVDTSLWHAPSGFDTDWRTDASWTLQADSWASERFSSSAPGDIMASQAVMEPTTPDGTPFPTSHQESTRAAPSMIVMNANGELVRTALHGPPTAEEMNTATTTVTRKRPRRYHRASQRYSSTHHGQDVLKDGFKMRTGTSIVYPSGSLCFSATNNENFACLSVSRDGESADIPQGGTNTEPTRVRVKHTQCDTPACDKPIAVIWEHPSSENADTIDRLASTCETCTAPEAGMRPAALCATRIGRFLNSARTRRDYLHDSRAKYFRVNFAGPHKYIHTSCGDCMEARKREEDQEIWARDTAAAGL